MDTIDQLLGMELRLIKGETAKTSLASNIAIVTSILHIVKY
jgi:hypothetical protein